MFHSIVYFTKLYFMCLISECRIDNLDGKWGGNRTFNSRVYKLQNKSTSNSHGLVLIVLPLDTLHRLKTKKVPLELFNRLFSSWYNSDLIVLADTCCKGRTWHTDTAPLISLFHFTVFSCTVCGFSEQPTVFSDVLLQAPRQCVYKLSCFFAVLQNNFNFYHLKCYDDWWTTY